VCVVGWSVGGEAGTGGGVGDGGIGTPGVGHVCRESKRLVKYNDAAALVPGY